MSSRILGMVTFNFFIEKLLQSDEQYLLELAEKIRENTFDLMTSLTTDQVQNMGPMEDLRLRCCQVWLTIQPWLMLK